MKRGDYSTFQKANHYKSTRFTGGLEIVAEDEARIINSWLKASNNEVFMDLGTGTGRAVVEILKQNPQRIYAVDSSSAMLNVLKVAFRSHIKNKKVIIIKADAQDTKVKKNSVNRATALHLLKHIQDPRPVFSEMARVLTINGVFIFDILNSRSLIRFYLGDCFAPEFKKIQDDLEGNGLRVEKVKTMHLAGETVYKASGPLGKLFQKFDTIVTNILPIGTKTFIYARKI